MNSIRYLFISLAVVIFILVVAGSQKDITTRPHYPTDIKETSDNQFLVSNKGDKTVVLYTPEFNKPVRTWEFEEVPTGIATRGDYAYITTFGTVGKLHFLNLKTGKVEKSLRTGSGARSPLLSPDGLTLYVLNQFENTVTRINLNTRQIIGSVEVSREPFKAVIGLEGKYLFVNNFLPANRADFDTVAASVSVIDLDGFRKVKDIPLANGSNALSGIALSPDGRYVLVTHTLARFGLPTSQLLQGWMNTSAMSMIDVSTLEQTATVLLDDPERGAGGIWGINSTAEKIIVTHSGTHEISVIDYPAFLEKYDSYTNKNSLNYDLSFMHGIRQRIPLTGNGPRDFIISGEEAIVTTYFSDILNLVNLDNGETRSVGLNESRMESQIDKGEKIFHDATHCFQNWQSCNSCHPGDGRTDGLNWDLLNDGVGNPKNTKSMLYSHVTPPSMISGIRETAEMAVRAGFTRIQFAEISEDHALCVDKYLKSLRPVPSPYLIDGKLSEKAERGKRVFEKLGCGACHSGPYYTDLNMYRVGQDVEFEKGWDTPTLIEVWRTAPYLFDGRAATMWDVYATHKHGIGKQVSEKEIEDLVEYVNSL
jgi:YVTN family beta-propeller protein